MKRILPFFLLLSCSTDHEFKPPQTFEECRNQAFARFNICHESWTMEARCEAGRMLGIQSCKEAFGVKDDEKGTRPGGLNNGRTPHPASP